MDKFERLVWEFQKRTASKGGLVAQRDIKINKCLNEIARIKKTYNETITKNEERMNQIRNQLYEIDSSRYKELWGL
ncbi:MAG TPA: hypothetical protein ENH82_12015 [bacterium]|nr:hypothetical protein [bacterium]